MAGLPKAGEIEQVRVLPAPEPHADWLVCAIWRRIAPDAGGATRSVVPATVYGCLNLVLHAEVRLGPLPGQVLPAYFLSGPLSMPLETWAAPGLHSLSLVLQPWVFDAWLGTAPRAFTDQLVDAAGLPRLAERPVVDALSRAARHDDGLGAALDLLRNGAEAAARAAAWPLAEALMASRTVGAAAGACHLGPRQFERRFSAAFGLAPKTWLRIKRLEALLHGVVGSAEPLAGLAADSGYADQAHMGRDFRRIVGLAPQGARTALSSGNGSHWALEPARPGRLPRPRTGR